jgi:hypothetical protein
MRTRMSRKIEQPDRERALLVCADRCKLIHAEAQDIVALIDFMEPDSGEDSQETDSEESEDGIK